MRSMDLVGTWSLESCVARGTNGMEILPLGDAPQGLLTYTADGYMSAVLMKSGRSRFASEDYRGGTSEDIRQAFEGFDAYAGTYEVDEAGGIITHHAEIARLPNWEGTRQVRRARLLDGKLELTTPPLAALGQEWVSTLVWHRADDRRQ